MQTRKLSLTAHLDDLQLADHRVPLDRLIQPNDAICNGKDRVVIAFLFEILPKQKGGRFAAGQMQSEPLRKALEIDLTIQLCVFATHHGPKGVHYNQARIGAVHLADDAV